LREDIEGYVEGRLAGVREEVARLQDQLNQALARLSERLSAEGQTDAPVAIAIADHLRQARNRGIEEAAQGSERARSSSDMAIIKAAIEDLEGQSSQSDILNALVNRAASFAPRVAFFVVRNERVTGWRARGLEGTVGDDSVREISLPVESDTLLGGAARSRRSWSGGPGSHGEDNSIYGHFGGEPPQRLVAVPLVVRGKSVAVLYADSAEQDAEAVNLEALETLVRVAGMAVALVAARRPAGQPEGQAAAAQPAPETHAAAEPRPDIEPEHAAEPAPSAEARAEEPTAVEEHAEAHEPAAEPAHAADAHGPGAGVEPAAAAASAPVEAEPEASVPLSRADQLAPAEPAASSDVWMGSAETGGLAAEPEPAFAPSQGETVTAPRRRYGADAELPVEVSDAERPVHDRARRFARLLVSEIKLYNEQKVREGRDNGDLYSRLRDDIDRSREVYDKRFAEQVGRRYDYFHHELVNTLAEGDSSRLGDGYPGERASG
jgi:hypothetical protein